ncbi:MAG: DUF4363 family protein [Clostridia bacterium]|nr:DUF4363 family protein [Clostridia bacterium]
MKSHSFRVISSLVILLALIVGASIYTTSALANSSKNIEDQISQIETDIKANNWENANKKLSEIESNWSRTEQTWAMLLDHIEIDNIDIALSRMSKYIEVKDMNLALAEAATLKKYIGHIPEKESFGLKNIF